MKKLIIIAALLVLTIVPAFSQDEGNSTTDAAGIGFGLQADIFRYVLTSSNNLLTTDNQYPTNFEVLEDYPITPGDVFTLLINYGANTEQSADYITTYSIQLQQDYTMSFPFVGKTDVRGMNVDDLNEFISRKIAETTPVQYITFYLSSPAHFNVFIYGGVNSSGFISATPLTTVIDAIAQCKGFKTNASYRDVRIEREGEIINIDISEFYKSADFDSNPKLKPGDKLYIPMAEEIVTISGMIKYPGTYEMLPGETLCDLIGFAGGLKPGAAEDRIEIARMDRDGKVAKSNIAAADADCTDLFNGDAISIPSTSDNAETITVEGAVYGKVISGTSPFTAPTSSVKLEVPYYPGIDLLTVMDKVGGPTPYAITEGSQVRRKKEGEFISFDLNDLWLTRDENHNIELKPGDHILIPIEKTFVGVFGALNSTDADTYNIAHVNGFTVMDYIVLAGGIDMTQGDINNIQLIDIEGNTTKVNLSDEVPPGSMIYVGTNVLYSVQDVFDNIFVITTIAVALIGLYNTVSSFITSF